MQVLFQAEFWCKHCEEGEKTPVIVEEPEGEFGGLGQWVPLSGFQPGVIKWSGFNLPPIKPPCDHALHQWRPGFGGVYCDGCSGVVPPSLVHATLTGSPPPATCAHMAWNIATDGSGTCCHCNQTMRGPTASSVS